MRLCSAADNSVRVSYADKGTGAVATDFKKALDKLEKASGGD
jgi:hypothetical protein